MRNQEWKRKESTDGLGGIEDNKRLWLLTRHVQFGFEEGHQEERKKREKKKKKRTEPGGYLSQGDLCTYGTKQNVQRPGRFVCHIICAYILFILIGEISVF